MKVILIEEVENLGRRGEVVNVADGYARNFLLPKKYAVAATPGNVKYVENQKMVWARQEAQLKEESELLARQLEEVIVSVEKKVGEGDNLYGSVTTMEIAQYFTDKGFHVDRRKIRLEHPIKTLGEYTIPIRLHHDVTAHVKLIVTKEGGDEDVSAPEAPVIAAEPMNTEPAAGDEQE